MEHRAPSTAPLYSAFLSYNHRDRVIAARLQRRLETYRLPSRIRRSAGLSHLRPVFRDRDELTAAADLSEAVRAALRQSEYLIVVCTPNAAGSEWVGREIDYFRSLRGDDRILSALFAGSGETSFHPALRTAHDGAPSQPLAADFRRGGDGRLALLKLVAVLAAVRLDELVQRDAHRRMRRFAAVATALIIALLGALALSIAALRARAAAEAERARSADAVRFQLTQLRGKLQTAGRLDLLAAASQSVARYYQGRNLAKLTVPELLNLAAARQNDAQDNEQRGRLAAADRAAREAEQITGALIKAAPNDGQILFAHAQSAYWVGFIDWRLGDRTAARVALERYAGMTNRLVHLDRDNLDWRLERAYARSNLGTLALVGSLDTANARRLFSQAQNDLIAVARGRPNDPDLRYEIADGEAWLADTDLFSGDTAGALRHRMAQQDVLDRLIAAAPANAHYQAGLGTALLNLGRVDAASGRYDDALRHFDASLALAGPLAANDPDNATLARQQRAIALFRAYTWLSMPRSLRPPRERIVQALGGCSAADPRIGNSELASFCAILQIRLALLAGDKAAARRDLLTLERQTLTTNSLTGEFHLDIGREIGLLHDQLKGS